MRHRDPVILQLANTWLILNAGGGPTDDKPTVTLTTPTDPNTVSAFLNIRAADMDIHSELHFVRGAGGARTRDQRIMRASHLRKWDLTSLQDVCRQTTVILTDTTEYIAETCRGLTEVTEAPADWRSGRGPLARSSS